MAADLNGQSLAIWNNLKPMIDEEIKSQTKGMVQRRKAKVTTAPSLSTGTIGVTEPFGPEYFIPFNTNLTTASVGDFVWVEFMYGATNAFASMYASADTKDYTVGGNLTVIGDEEVNGNTTINGVLDVTPRRNNKRISGVGWYRIIQYSAVEPAAAYGSYPYVLDIELTRSGSDSEAHKISLMAAYNKFAFIGEDSNSVDIAISKIRVMKNDSLVYIDIYCNSSGSFWVSTWFSVAVDADFQSRFTAAGLTSVADSPANETEMATHNFIATGHNFTMPIYMNGTLIHS